MNFLKDLYERSRTFKAILWITPIAAALTIIVWAIIEFA